MVSIAVDDSTTIQVPTQLQASFRSVANFGTGGGTDVQPEQSQIGVSTNSLYESIRLGVRRNVWYGVFVLIQLHFWYGISGMVNRVTAQPQEQIHDLWLGNSAQNSTSEAIYRAPSLVPVTSNDILWHHRHFKLLLCCVCLLASVYVKRIDCYLPQICSVSDGECLQSKQSQPRSVSKVQRIKQLQEISVLVLRTIAWAFVMFESAIQLLLKFDPEGVAFGVDPSNCARAAVYAIYLTAFSPSSIYWIYDILRWVIIWTVFPFQIFLYLGFGGQYVTLCCTFNLVARACTLNIARIHILGMLHEWSAAKHTQELVWVLAFFLLASELELAPRLICITALSCAVVCVKIWVARVYCDAILGLDDTQDTFAA